MTELKVITATEISYDQTEAIASQCLSYLSCTVGKCHQKSVACRPYFYPTGYTEL